jgi:tetratricopeptide (TPR) repeat protein
MFMQRSHRALQVAILIFFGAMIAAPRASANEARTGGPSSDAQLGSVSFPTSCSAEAQPIMITGVAYLHSFQYMQAKETFREAAKRDPHCAMAHWGEAMSLYHQLWDFPQPDTIAEGGKDIEEAQKIGAPTERERGYIAAAAAFFADNSKLTHLDRVKAYSMALAKLHEQSPDDVEAAAFYALSLVALAYEDQPNETADRKAAIAILQPLFRSHPDDPGVAHYLIHATDTPELAPLGLEAARRYAKIAPDSAHAIHMPSHIFVRLGLWQESIASNIAAAASGAHAIAMHQAEFHYQTHPMDFLNYSYLQAGQEAKARQVIADVQNVGGASDEEKADISAGFAARTALELHRWKEAATLPVPKIREVWLDTTYWARAIGAARSGDVSEARADVAKLTEAVGAREKHEKEQGYTVPTEKATDLSEAEAWLLFAEGKHEEALKEMRAAADREDKEDNGSLEIPAREMLADMLLELKRPSEALAEYKVALKNSPNRFDSLYGAGRAAQASGDTKSAHEFDAKLVEICGPDADRPELAEAKSYLALAQK